MDTFDGFWIRAEEVIDAGEETVIAVEQFGGRAKLSGVPTDQACAVVLTIRNKKIARCVEYETPPRPSKPPGCRSRPVNGVLAVS
jgi:ketosteroid isomerase-like protein